MVKDFRRQLEEEGNRNMKLELTVEYKNGKKETLDINGLTIEGSSCDIGFPKKVLRPEQNYKVHTQTVRINTIKRIVINNG
jgi:hypothetical protein